MDKFSEKAAADEKAAAINESALKDNEVTLIDLFDLELKNRALLLSLTDMLEAHLPEFKDVKGKIYDDSKRHYNTLINRFKSKSPL